ncbi:MAG: transglutaminase domain-containing protein [Ferruginibacter sp.]
MIQLIKHTTFLLVLLVSFKANAQTNGRDFTAIDAYVKSLGPLDSMSMGTINNVVSNKFTDKIDKARAIYYWIAHNITYDIKAARSNNTAKNSPAEVLLYRRAVGIGFASLFQDMCSSADIRCLTVDGYVKNSVEQIKEKGAEINHSWAVVQLGQSPETWYYVDPAWGSGFADPEMKVFTKSYTDVYFFAEKANFNLQHFPDNEAWKLGPAPKGKKDFFENPVIRVAALEFDMKKYTPNNGNLKVKVNKAVNFSYTLNGKEEVTKVELGMGEKKKYKIKEIPFSFSRGVLSFSYKFEDESSYPLTVLINGKELMFYYVEVE